MEHSSQQFQGFERQATEAAFNPERGAIAGHFEGAAKQSPGNSQRREGRTVFHPDQPAMAYLLHLA